MTSAAEHIRPSVSIIIPALNEEHAIRTTLKSLALVEGAIEVIVVDGGSDDRTVEVAREFGATVVISARGRGTQMHNGAKAARGQTLLFLHADTIAPPNVVKRIEEALLAAGAAPGGRFDVRFSGTSRSASFMTWLYPKLAKLGLHYGDAGIFVRASVYEEIGGFNSFPLFEDLDFIKRLKKKGRISHVPVELVTSSRRFEGCRFPFTFARWSMLQALYWFGVPPRTLGKLYAPRRSVKLQSFSKEETS